MVGTASCGIAGGKAVVAVVVEDGKDSVDVADPEGAVGIASGSIAGGKAVVALRDALFETAVAAGLGPTKEGRFLLPGNDRRPADHP